ncbi:4-oxalocrotonate tautomerase [Oscillospiraceae bacterium OttesenSCG-928-G22]|nr:4-oxalocrotonate tautomerase [Oscillospiraceae bacterium OttesenSCG-928-G22]MDL2289065.1 4-oxalocrotonate tautomerase [Oscillospiraceae bacterium OttesenSCG-928-F05]
MNETRGITVKVDAALHQRAKTDQEARELTMSEYITMVLEEHFTKREGIIMNTRTMAFQVDEALFRRIKAHLNRTGLTQKAFVIGLIEQALSEAEDGLTADNQQTDAEATATDEADPADDTGMGDDSDSAE